jgi:hypothetical protein
MKVVEKNGKVTIREPSRTEKLRSAINATIKHLDQTVVTKTELMKTYEMSYRDITELVNTMLADGTLQDKGRDLNWEVHYLVCKPAPPVPKKATETPQEAAQRRKTEALYRRYDRWYARPGTCARCGGPMPGTSRHGRTARGHTKEVCDFQLVCNIQNS